MFQICQKLSRGLTNPPAVAATPLAPVSVGELTRPNASFFPPRCKFISAFDASTNAPKRTNSIESQKHEIHLSSPLSYPPGPVPAPQRQSRNLRQQPIRPCAPAAISQSRLLAAFL